MTDELIYAFPEPAAAEPLTFDQEICIGCNTCVDVCQADIMVPHPEYGMPPIVLYPGECWYDGSCVRVCPEPGAISLNSLSMNRVHWKRKDTGEDFFL
jgi:NAD-dependent dihydropyrimidine dehydrogenase PreA subunit